MVSEMPGINATNTQGVSKPKIAKGIMPTMERKIIKILKSFLAT